MKFVDQVRIYVKAGNGGDGAVAFRREKYIEKGGPSGGDGGHGGSVIFVADKNLTTLLDFRYLQHHKAPPGQAGMGSDRNGIGGEDLTLRVPVGTLFKDHATDELLMDLAEDGQQYVAAKGGRGGLGNINFATSTRQTPRFAQDGKQGEEKTLVLELKLLADVGLLGFPNAGKSTLIARVSRARPKIADYPFTTLVPNLGLVQYKDNLSFVMADIPGLIEGASEGQGLGMRFLRHVDRCRVLIHLVDLSAEGEGREPLRDWALLNRELARYSPDLAQKPQVIAANKVDLPDARARLAAFEKQMNKRGHVVFAVSTATGEGVPELLDAAARVLFTPQDAWQKAASAPNMKGLLEDLDLNAPAPSNPAAMPAAPEMGELSEKELERLTRPELSAQKQARPVTRARSSAKGKLPVNRKPIATRKPAAKSKAIAKRKRVAMRKPIAVRKPVAKLKVRAKRKPVAKRPSTPTRKFTGKRKR